MLVGDDDQASMVAATLAAAVIQNMRTTDPDVAAAVFQQIATALGKRGAVPKPVAERTVFR